MAAQDMRAAKSAIVAGLMATGIPAQTASLMADQQITLNTSRPVSDGGGGSQTPQIFGVKWYWVALGAAVGVVLLARK